MASYLPPTDNLPNFNPGVFQSGDDSGITLSDADQRYVKKSGSIMTGSLSTPVLLVNSINVETKLDDITNIETATTGITYDNTGDVDKTTIGNNVEITGTFILPGITNVETEINKISDIETATIGITYDSATDKTTIDNNVTISNTLLLGTTNVGTELVKITALETITQDLTFSDLNGTSLFVNNVLGTQNHGNVDTKLTSLDGEVDALQVATTKLTYSNVAIFGGTEDKSTLDCNVTISAGKNLLLGTTNIGTEVVKIGDLETATTGITYDNTGGVDKTTIGNNVEITGTFILPNHTNVDTKLSSLNTQLSGITYDNTGGIDKTIIDNNVKITGTLDIPTLVDVGTKISNIIEDITGITYDNTGGIDSTNIDNNITISSGKRIDTPEIRSQIYRANDSTQTLFQNSSGVTRMVILNQGKVGIQTSTPQFDLTVNGDCGIVEDLIVLQNITAQSLVTYRSRFCYGPNEATNNRWGDNNYPNRVIQSSYIGSSSGPEIYYDGSERIRFASTGTYKVVCHMNIDCINQPTGDRTIFAAYISTNGDTTKFRNSSGTNAGGWGQTYLRNGSADTGNKMVWSGSFDMSDYVTITNTSDYVTINTRMYFNDSSNLTFQDDAPEANYDVWTYVEVEKTSDSTSLFTTMPFP